LGNIILRPAIFAVVLKWVKKEVDLES